MFFFRHGLVIILWWWLVVTVTAHRGVQMYNLKVHMQERNMF